MDTEVSESKKTTQLLKDIASRLVLIHFTLKDFVDAFKAENCGSSEILLDIQNKISIITECAENAEIMSENDQEIVFEENPNEVTALSVKQGIFRIWKRSLNERKMITFSTVLVHLKAGVIGSINITTGWYKWL